MTDRAFVIMQVGAKESAERKRADEIYEFLIAPSIRESELEPYRADLDAAPGAITPKMLLELLNARVVIADLTAPNPNVFYELGITHSFARPLILIAESTASLPFDAKDERVIELGEYPQHGLTYAQGERVKAALRESLRIVMAPDYPPPSPLREVAASRSLDQLAPDNPLAAEMSRIRETLDEIVSIREPLGEMTRIRETLDLIRIRVTKTPSIPGHLLADIAALRQFIEQNLPYLDALSLASLVTDGTSPNQLRWTQDLRGRLSANDNEQCEGELPGDGSA